jgi:hypothetical protein
LGFVVHAAYFVQAGVDRQFMIRWWTERGGFAPFPTTSLGDLLWYPRHFSGLTYLAFRQLGLAHPGIELGWVDPLGWVLALALVLALIVGCLARRWTSIVVAGTLLLTFLAAMLDIYPFSSRLLIFLVPLILFAIASGVDELHRISAIGAWAAAIIILGVMVPSDTKIATKPWFTSDMRGAFARVERGFQPGDGIALAAASRFLPYYGQTFLHQKNSILKIQENGPATSVIEFAEKNGYQRVWVVSYRKKGKKQIKETAQRVPTLFEWSTHGTRVILFDFRKH